MVIKGGVRLFNIHHMIRRNALSALLLLIVIALVAACGSSGTSLSNSSGGSAGNNSGSTDARALPLGTSVPPVPNDLGAAPPHSSSSVGLQEYMGAGPALINYSGGTVEGDSLILTSSETDMAWAMYRAEGLAGLWVSTFGVLTIPENLDTTYFVGFSNFTRNVWDWMIETTLPEVDFDLSANEFRLVSALGNLYWVVAVPAGGHSVTVLKSQLVVDEFPGGGGWLPGGGNFLFASQGLPGFVELQWGSIDGATDYELYRRVAPDPVRINENDEFELLATTSDCSYFDSRVEYWLPYEYKVRAINPFGPGDYSEIALGWAADPNGGGDPPGGDPLDAGASGEIQEIGADYLTLITNNEYDFQPIVDFVLAPDTVYIAADGTFVDREYFSATMHVYVTAHFDDGGFRIAEAVGELPDGNGDPGRLSFAAGIITSIGEGLLKIEDNATGAAIEFLYDDQTQWIDVSGNILAPENFSIGEIVGVTYVPDLAGIRAGNYAVLVQQYGGSDPGIPQGTIVGTIINIDQGMLDVDSSPGLAYHFLTNENTLWFDANGNAISPSDFAVGDTVAVTYSENAEGQQFALQVVLGGGDPSRR